MATIYSAQYTQAYITKPSTKILPGDQSGGINFLYFDYVVTAAPTAADILVLAKLPKGARLVEACLSFPDLGTTGVLNVGWAASAEKDGPQGTTGTALEAASAAGIMAAVDVNAAADTVLMSSGVNVAGMLKHFTAAVDVQIDIATAWTATSGTIKGYLAYVIV